MESNTFLGLKKVEDFSCEVIKSIQEDNEEKHCVLNFKVRTGSYHRLIIIKFILHLCWGVCMMHWVSLDLGPTCVHDNVIVFTVFIMIGIVFCCLIQLYTDAISE